MITQTDMRSGTIEIASGRWHWTLLPRWTGATIVFQHRDRLHDEMRSWTPEQELTDDQAVELAVDALERTWVDMDGLKWRLSMELPTDLRRAPSGGFEVGRMCLVFKRGGVKWSCELPAERRLGELSHSTLVDLLKESQGSKPDL